jgi:predicted DNA-binding transcriptional regulator AlpA
MGIGGPDIKAVAATTPTPDGISAELGTLPSNTLITEKALAGLLGRAVKSIKRAVARGELPPPVRILGESRWTVGTIVRHVEKRLEAAALEADRARRRLAQDSP